MRIVLGRSVSHVSHGPRHPEVNQEHATRFEPKNQILAAPIDGLDDLSLELGGDLQRLDRPGDARVADLDLLESSTREHRLQTSPDGLDLGELRHAASLAARPRGYARVSRMIPVGSGASVSSVYAAWTSATAASADASSRAWISARISPAATLSPRLARQTMPTEWSMGASLTARPAPRWTEAMPTASAPSRVTVPSFCAETSRTTGARGRASSDGSPPCARIQRSYASRAEPSRRAVSVRERASSASTPSQSATRCAADAIASSVRSVGPSPRSVATASRISRALPTACPRG